MLLSCLLAFHLSHYLLSLLANVNLTSAAFDHDQKRFQLFAWSPLMPKCPWLPATATPRPHPWHMILCPRPKQLPLMLPQPTFLTTHVLSNYHMLLDQGNTDDELVTPRSSRLFKIEANSRYVNVEETDSEGYTNCKTLEKYFFGIIGHLRDRHGQRLDSWTLRAQMANYWREWFNVPTEGSYEEPSPPSAPEPTPRPGPGDKHG